MVGFFGAFLNLFLGFGFLGGLDQAGYGPVNAGYGPVNSTAGYGPVNSCAGYGPVN